MASFRALRSLFVASVLPLFAFGCSAEAGDDAESADSAQTGWLADTSFELGASFRSTVQQRATGAWADLMTSEDQQVALVDAQWKFAKHAVEAAGYHLNQLADTVTIVDKREDNGVVTLTYEAKVDLIKEIRSGQTPPSIEQIQPRALSLKLPQRPTTAYADARGKCVDTSDGSPSGEYNFYYYFDATAEGCALPTVDVTVSIDEVYPRGTVYPEYDRLLEDLGNGKRGFRAALLPAEGDYDPMSRFDAHRRMLERDLGLVGERTPDGKVMKFSYARGDVAIGVDLFDPTKIDFTPQFRAALGDYSLVFYNGHSRYGTREFLTDRASFSSKYQIVMMHSCRSYPYYVRQVFRAKATSEDPTGWLGADVVATGESSYPTDSPRTLRPLLEGMVAADGAGGRGAPNWLSIVKKMNDRTRGIMYGVAGVRTNVWAPR